MPTCLLCGCSRSQSYLSSRDRLSERPKQYSVARCTGCGFRYLWPRPHSSEYEAIYPAHYPPHRAPLSKLSDVTAGRSLKGLAGRMELCRVARMGYTGLANAAAAAGRTVSLRSRLLPGKWDHELIRPHGRCRMLDVGCGTGQLLYLHQELGWEAWGVEPSAAASETARRAGLNVITGRVECVGLPENYFDVIVLMHVLEHVEDPVSFLKHLLGLLAPGGEILIEVPNADSFGQRIWRNYWFALDLPRHLSHFTLANLEHLAALTGYRVVRRLTRSIGDWHACSLDSWLEDRRWIPSALRSRKLAERVRLEKKLRPILNLLFPRWSDDVLRIWLQPTG